MTNYLSTLTREGFFEYSNHMKGKDSFLPAMLLCDFYKVSHKNLYPEGMQTLYTTGTPRSNKYFPKSNKVVSFGQQLLVKRWFIEFFNTNFFNRPKEEVIYEYERVIKYTQGVYYVDSSHIAELHDLGYLPIKVKAIKEGKLVPIKVPLITIENTNKKFYWLTNYLETLISTELWQSFTSATISHTFRLLLDKYALLTTGTTDGVEFQAHDFSMRGMSSIETAVRSGAGHLLSSYGTDTIGAILELEKYYNASIELEMVGTSIPATEHSIQSSLTPADSNRDEREAFKRIITDVYPTGFVSIVSDTYDFWKVVSETLPSLKEAIMNRDGRVVIRPDSGNPVDILAGTEFEFGKGQLPEEKGLIESLWDIFGGEINDKGFRVLDPHIGAIYGDSITIDRAEQISERLMNKGFASTNVVYGIGSYSYQANTRDTFGFAMKATHAVINDEEVMLFKDPKTDDGTKRSQRGRVVVVEDEDGDIHLVEGMTIEQQKEAKEVDLLETIFINGVLVKDQYLSDIRDELTASRKSILTKEGLYN